MEKKFFETTVAVEGWKGMKVTIYLGHKDGDIYYRAKANCGEKSCGQQRFDSHPQSTEDKAVNRIVDIANNHIKTRHDDFKK